MRVVAREILGGVELGLGQVAQPRAIDHEFQQRLYAILHVPGPGGGEAKASRPGPSSRSCARSW